MILEEAKTIPFTVVVPTQGRQTLIRCLESMLPQYHNGVRPEIIVVHDTYEVRPDFLDVQEVCDKYSVKYLAHSAHTSNWGYPQLQIGYEEAVGAYIFNIGDDDIYNRGAFQVILDVINRLDYVHPLMFKAILHPSPHRGNLVPVTLWETTKLVRSRVTGQNFGCPNNPERMGFWWDDFCQMEATINLWNGEVTWIDEVIAQCY